MYRADIIRCLRRMAGRTVCSFRAAVVLTGRHRASGAAAETRACSVLLFDTGKLAATRYGMAFVWAIFVERSIAGRQAWKLAAAFYSTSATGTPGDFMGRSGWPIRGDGTTPHAFRPIGFADLNVARRYRRGHPHAAGVLTRREALVWSAGDDRRDDVAYSAHSATRGGALNDGGAYIHAGV